MRTPGDKIYLVKALEKATPGVLRTYRAVVQLYCTWYATTTLRTRTTAVYLLVGLYLIQYETEVETTKDAETQTRNKVYQVPGQR